MQRAVSSLLDNDLYCFTMGQFAFDQARDVEVEYRFACRSAQAAHDLSVRIDQMRAACRMLADLRLTPAEADYLRCLGHFSEAYLAHLMTFHFDPRRLTIERHRDEFTLRIAGPWVDTILYEVPVLATLSQTLYGGKGMVEGERRLAFKCRALAAMEAYPGFEVVEFGTRRRKSAAWQYHVLRRLVAAAPTVLTGTSNPMLAREFNLPCIGTMAHQYLQAWQALSPDLESHQRRALLAWLDQFGGKLGIALTDCLTTEAFLADFGPRFAEAYAGVRQDSGDPLVWGGRLLEHYRDLGIDPHTKTAVFSDGLTVEKAADLFRSFHKTQRAGGFGRTVFGIGTHLTADCGQEPMDGVIKLAYCDGKPVAKISDSPGKATCPDPAFLARVKEAFDIR